jgi:hypothetical protein
VSRGFKAAARRAQHLAARVASTGVPIVTAVQTSKFKPMEQLLREQGLMPVRWPSARVRLSEAGIPPRTYSSVKTGYAGPLATPGIDLSNKWWAPSWAVLVAECDPCKDEAKVWMLKRAVREPEVKAQLEALATLMLKSFVPTESVGVRTRFADVVMELWNPEEEP